MFKSKSVIKNEKSYSKIANNLKFLPNHLDKNTVHKYIYILLHKEINDFCVNIVKFDSTIEI